MLSILCPDSGCNNNLLLVRAAREKGCCTALGSAEEFVVIIFCAISQHEGERDHRLRSFETLRLDLIEDVFNPDKSA